MQLFICCECVCVWMEMCIFFILSTDFLADCLVVRKPTETDCWTEQSISKEYWMSFLWDFLLPFTISSLFQIERRATKPNNATKFPDAHITFIIHNKYCINTLSFIEQPKMRVALNACNLEYKQCVTCVLEATHTSLSLSTSITSQNLQKRLSTQILKFMNIFHLIFHFPVKNVPVCARNFSALLNIHAWIFFLLETLQLDVQVKMWIRW